LDHATRFKYPPATTLIRKLLFHLVVDLELEVGTELLSNSSLGILARTSGVPGEHLGGDVLDHGVEQYQGQLHWLATTGCPAQKPDRPFTKVRILLQTFYQAISPLATA
jgi:hypothetical protein